MKRSGFEFQITTRSLSLQWVKIMRSSCNNIYINLLDYGSRRFDPEIGRFISADTLIPGAGNSQAWDRFAYVNNSPVRYSDPSGHRPIEEQGGKRGCTNSMYCRYSRPKPVAELIRLHEPSSCAPTLTEPVSDINVLMEYLRFSGTLLDFLDKLEDAAEIGRPIYKQMKYLASFGVFEYGIDAALQFYDDRNLELSIQQRIGRSVIRGIESGFIDVASAGMGILVAASSQIAIAEIPIVPIGVGYAIGAYSSSTILTAAAERYNPVVFGYFNLGVAK